MGRRSINTTKSGKYMNPTDQARKEARKQELKKNKKQRQLVRAAVLKGKDPQQLLEELEKIDQMGMLNGKELFSQYRFHSDKQFNVCQPSPLNEKVLKDKRKKLRETLDRVLSMYYKDDPEKWADLKRKQTDYEHRRNQLVSFYESVKSAQQVTVDEIPLPQLPQQPTPAPSLQIPLPTEIKKPEHTIYSIATALKLQALGHPIREPPGCPPGPPPDVNSDGEVEDYITEELDVPTLQRDDLEQDESLNSDVAEKPKPTSLQQKMVALSGQNVDDFMKEMEQVAQKKQEERDERPKMVHIDPPAPPGTDPLPMKPPLNPPGPPPGLFQNVGLRVPPGPPPGRPMLPPGPPPGLPPRLPPIRIGGPPRMLRLPGPPPNLPPPGQTTLALGTPNVLSAAPQLIHRTDMGGKQSATISAKPQIRNLSADVTRFVPSALRVKREDKKPKPSRAALVNELKQKEIMITKSHPSGQPSKDDAYMQFMKEMQGLL